MESASPVFIIGGSRTGSTMLRIILCTSREIDLVSELLLMAPRWLHKDVTSSIRQYVGDLNAPGALDRLIEMLYSDIPYDKYWGVIKRAIDRDQLREELSKDTLNVRALLRAIMVVHARKKGKPRIGAKFPLHYSYTNKLLEWFPDCKLIHTTRNPKAVYASQSSKHTSRDMGFLPRNYSRLQQFVHINIQTAWTAHVHRQLRELPNYRLVRYEDIVLQPEKTLGELCDFVEISLTPEMLNPIQYGSSYKADSSDRRGIDNSSLEKWRTIISPLTAHIIDLGHRRASRLLGYPTK